jgi:alanyl-tRNA synthetase
MTRKLYLEDAYLRSCTSTIIRREETEDGELLVLDASCFYPEGGGQPSDTGTVAGREVVHVHARDGEVVHRIKGRCDRDSVRCVLDWHRRMDHMQQHTGQHIISHVIDRIHGVGTESLHIGRHRSTIDLPIDELTADDVRTIEDEANAIVYDNHPIRCYVTSSVDARELRKRPTFECDVRIVEIEDVEKTPCGGTHCSCTAEVGIIHIPRWYKKGPFWRIEFVCGMRALTLLREQGTVLESVSSRLDVPSSELDARVYALKEEKEGLYHRVQDLVSQRARLDLAQGLQEAHVKEELRIVKAVFDEPERAKALAQLAADTPSCVVLAGTYSTKGATLFFAASHDSGFDVRSALDTALKVIHGKGGGSPYFVTGHGPLADALDDALCRALDDVGRGR